MDQLTSQDIFQVVTGNLHSSGDGQAALNDIWHHKLTLKGRDYSLEELSACLRPGSRIAGDIYDFNYMVDDSILNRDDPVTRRILEQGQEPFGGVILDQFVDGLSYSSKYLASIPLAAEIIHRLDKQGFKTPRIMEIGGGVGLLMQALRKYYGPAATIYAVDLPETLLIQDWLLRHWFPSATFRYKGGAKAGALAEGGINMINAHILASLDIAVDCVINIHSMMEMEQATADRYLGYAADHLSIGGFVLYENHFGHGSRSAIAPSEHVLAPQLGIGDASLAYQSNTFSVYESMRLVLEKTKVAANAADRSYVLRLLWNGLNAGLIPWNGPLVSDLAAAAQGGRDAVSAQASAVCGKYSVCLDNEIFAALAQSPHLAQSRFLRARRSRAAAPAGRPDDPAAFMECMWEAQTGLIALMRDMAEAGSPADGLRRVDSVADTLLERTRGFAPSEHRALNMAAFLLPIGRRADASKLIADAIARSRNPYWLLRLAQVSALFGAAELAQLSLSQIDAQRPLDPIVSAQIAEIWMHIGHSDRARDAARRLARDFESHGFNELLVVARLFALTRCPEELASAVRHVLARDREFVSDAILDLLGFLLRVHPEASTKDVVRRVVESRFAAPRDVRTRLSGAILTYGADPTEAARANLDAAFAALSDEYHVLGWAGREFIHNGHLEMGTRCLQRSLLLKEHNFLHLDFVGSILFFAGLWDAASSAFDEALRLVPYVRNVQAGLAYSRIPDLAARGHIFGGPIGICAAFQRNQDWYSDIARPVKPRPMPLAFAAQARWH